MTIPFAILHHATSICAEFFFSFFVTTDSSSSFSFLFCQFCLWSKFSNLYLINSAHKGVGSEAVFRFPFHPLYNFLSVPYCFVIHCPLLKYRTWTSNPTTQTKLDNISHRDKKAFLGSKCPPHFLVFDDLVGVFPHLKSTKVFA